MFNTLKQILPLAFIATCFFISEVSFSQANTRSFDQKKIKEYRSREDYDYFRRAFGTEKNQNHQSQNSNSSSSGNSKTYRSKKVNFGGTLFNGLSGMGWFILIIAVVAIIAVIIILIANNADGRGRTRNEVLQANTLEIEQELDEEEIDKNDFESLIQKAKSKGNYRLAIRLMFLKSLQGLDEKKLIKYKKNKTNYEYTFEIKNKDIQNLFKNASDSFSWVWYGNYDITDTMFYELEPSFQTLIRKIEG